MALDENMTDELGRIRGGYGIIGALSWNLPGGAEENQKTCQSG
jgi:hypothetical protein